MATLSVIQSYSVVIDGHTFTGGSGTADTFPVAGETIFDRIYSITSSTTVATEIFRAGSAVTDDIADWEFLFIESDVAAEIRLVMNEGGGATETRHGLVIALRAGAPLMFTGGDASRGTTDANVDDNLASGGSDVFSEAAGVIDAIEYNQRSGGVGVVRVVAIR